MNTRYDPQILQKFADALYSKADSAVVLCVILGVVIGGFAGFFMGSTVAMVIGLVILGALGFAVGMSIAFQLRLRAQTVLCQKQIEENTRRTVEHRSPSTTISPVAPMLSNTNARYYYSTDGEQQHGPVDASDLRMMRKDGMITDDILVLREGEKQWHKFGDYLELNR